MNSRSQAAICAKAIIFHRRHCSCLVSELPLSPVVASVLSNQNTMHRRLSRIPQRSLLQWELVSISCCFLPRCFTFRCLRLHVLRGVSRSVTLMAQGWKLLVNDGCTMGCGRRPFHPSCITDGSQHGCALHPMCSPFQCGFVKVRLKCCALSDASSLIHCT
jgi:hypothetical protein